MAKNHPKQRDSLVSQYPPCYYCRHLVEAGTLYQEHDIENSFEDWTCKAFPEGIPWDILSRDSSHVKPAAGQKGQLVFASRRLNTGGGETGYQFITFDGRYVEEPEE